MKIILTFTALLFIPHLLHSSYTTEILRPAFEKTFADRCNTEKYPFMERYYQNLENPSNRFVHFVFHEHGLKNGGFGDRLAGLVSSAFIAIRFNRTLVIESGNGFDELFRPYHPRLRDYMDPITKQTEVRWLQDGSDRIGPNYRNWTSWAPYDIGLSNNDATEYDLWNCININGAWTSTCGMDKSDAGQPIVKIRGNRAYICKWDKEEAFMAHHQMRDMGMKSDTNLYEMAGCMLRLAMWPTEKMWEYIDKEMIAAARDMPASMSTEASANAQRSGPGGTTTPTTPTTTTASQTAVGASGSGLSVSSSELLQLFAGGATASMTINGTLTTVSLSAGRRRRHRRRLLSDNHSNHSNNSDNSNNSDSNHYNKNNNSSSSTTAEASPVSTDTQASPTHPSRVLQDADDHLPLAIITGTATTGGLGERTFFTSNPVVPSVAPTIATTDTTTATAATTAAATTEARTTTTETASTGGTGTGPVVHWDYQIGLHFRCGDRSYIDGAAADLGCTHDATGTNPHAESDYMRYGTPLDLGHCANEVLANLSSAISHSTGKAPANVLIFIASDNHGSALQMNETLVTSTDQVGQVASFIPPHGCHVEMDTSIECAELTLGYWLALAMSDVIVTQSDPTDGGGAQDARGSVSAFSRYAVIYGLKNDQWRDGQKCGERPSEEYSSRHWHGNWFCT